MSKKLELYADGVEKINFINGMLRYDFLTLENVDGKNQKELSFRVIMSQIGFLSTLNTMNKMADKLIAAGVLRREGSDDKEISAKESSAPKAAPKAARRGRPPKKSKK